MKSLKVSKLLRKSYKIRSTLDVLVNSKNLVLFDNSKYNEEKFNSYRKDLAKFGIFLKLLNKDDLLNSRFGLYAKGPTIIMFSDNEKKTFEFLGEYIKNQKKDMGDILLLKFVKFLGLEFYKKINEKFSFDLLKVVLNVFLLLSNSKILFGILVGMFKLHFLSLKFMFVRNFLLLNFFKSIKK
jgi:hypothetical protein